MAERIVIDTGPLIALERIEVLDIVGRLPFEFLCPQEVRDELDEGALAGHPRIEPPWLSVKRLKEPISPVSLSALDRGEAAVIQLALEHEIPLVCIDEWKGRRGARGGAPCQRGSRFARQGKAPRVLSLPTTSDRPRRSTRHSLSPGTRPAASLCRRRVSAG